MEDQNIQSQEPVENNETVETPVKEETVSAAPAPVKAAKSGGTKLSGKTIGIICGAVAVVAIIVVCLVLFLGDSVEKLMEKGLNAYNSGQSQEAKEYFEKAADKGNTDANFYLGEICENSGDMPNAAFNYEKAAKGGNGSAAERLGFILYEGNGVTQNKEQARTYFEMALQTSDDHSEQFYYDLGMLCYDGVGGTSDYAAAKSYFESAEIRGSAEASYMLGTYYEDGDKRVNRDILKAIDYYDRSARGGNIGAAERLGIIFTEDAEVEPDYSKAAVYFNQAAEGGSTYLYGNIGMIFYKGGHGVDRDLETAKAFFEQAVNNGVDWDSVLSCLADCYMESGEYDKAQAMVEKVLAKSDADDSSKARVYLIAGQLFQAGQGVDKDYNKAMEFYQAADNLGSKNAKAYIGDMYYKGLGVDKDYNQAFAYFDAAISNGCDKGFAYHRVGYLYYSGNVVAQDYATAKKYFEVAYNYNDAPGTYMLGYLYYKGYGVKANLKKAAAYFEKAAAQNNAAALEVLGYMYHHGEHYDVDMAKALDYYQKSEALGNALAMYQLGVCYRDGIGVTQDYNKAAEYFQKGAKKDNMSCIGALGILHYDGKGVEEDNEKAFQYMSKALDSGLEWPSMYWRIGCLYSSETDGHRDRDLAVYYLEKAINAGEEDHHMWSSYAYELYLKGNYTDSAKYYARAIDQSIIQGETKNKPTYLYCLGAILTHLKKYPEAAQYIAQALDEGYADKEGAAKSLLQKLINQGYVKSSVYGKYVK